MASGDLAGKKYVFHLEGIMWANSLTGGKYHKPDDLLTGQLLNPTVHPSVERPVMTGFVGSQYTNDSWPFSGGCGWESVMGLRVPVRGSGPTPRSRTQGGRTAAASGDRLRADAPHVTSALHWGAWCSRSPFWRSSRAVLGRITASTSSRRTP